MVVTIVILVILATISIYAVLGENGLMKKAEEARGVYEQAKLNEEAGLSSLEEYLNGRMAGQSGGNSPEYNDNTLPVAPKVADGMTKVKYNSATGNWERVTDNEAEWYNYEAKEWANVVLGDATFNGNILDESAPYTQLVWIPRYAYKITSMYHQNGDETTAGNIEVVFIDTANKNKAKTTTYSTTYPEATVEGSMADFVVHPAFEYGGQHLAGIWVGKFESSHTGCGATGSSGESAEYTGEVMTVRANVTSWRELTLGNMFEICLNMNTEENPYGLNTNDSVVDPHLMKNDEWGACAYLSKSAYGKETEEVYINNNSNYITGIAGNTASASITTATTNSYKTTAGVKASTNGNATGVYDMSGGAWEYTAAYVNNGYTNLTSYGGDLTVPGTASKYRNVYTQGSSDSGRNNYAVSTPADGKYGDAVYETSNSYTGSNSWYADDSFFPYANSPFFRRGGVSGNHSYAGMFSISPTLGASAGDDGFRVSVSVL